MPDDKDASAKVESLKNNSSSGWTGVCPKCGKQYKTERGLNAHINNGCKPKEQKAKGTHGGARQGAGRPEGSMNEETKKRMEIKRAFESRIADHADDLFNAQFILAMGATVVFKVELRKGGKRSAPIRVTDPEEISAAIDQKVSGKKPVKAQYFFMVTEKPDPRAIESLLDRAFGKAPQSMKITDERPDPISEILTKFGLIEGNEDAGKAEEA